MKVYIINIIENYEDHICLGVFLKKEDAIQMCLESDLNPTHSITEHEVIE
jgi:hypothetical protein